MNSSARTIGERIMDRATVEDRGFVSPCWISDRSPTGKGYTKMYANGRLRLTHRVSYEWFIGPIGADLQIDHLCRQRACCNPSHLEPVTCRTNLLRGDTVTAREAAQTHCKRGHLFDAANTYRRPDRVNSRGCRTCLREAKRVRARA